MYFQSDAGWEEYYDYIFPDDESDQANQKLLGMAKMFMAQKATGDSDSESSDSEGGSSDESESDSEQGNNTRNPTNNFTDSDSGEDWEKLYFRIIVCWKILTIYAFHNKLI